jgi:SRSO17 transposase
MSLLEHPTAQALLEDAKVSTGTVRVCREHLTGFLQRYLPLFCREEQREHACLAIEGRLSGLERKTTEPIANQAGIPRRNLQRFVGAGEWDDEAVMAEARRHVIERLGDLHGVLVLDPSSFPKKGTASCGVKRQWCGRLGKTENCQVGVFLWYAAGQGHAPLDRRLYLPEDWAEDKQRRQATYVPKVLEFQHKWQIGLDLLRSSEQVPHAWVVADDEFGRVAEFRQTLRERGQQYVLDVPCNTLVRDLAEPIPRRSKGAKGRSKGRRKPPFRRADAWARRQPDNRWQELEVRAGSKGPLKVKAIRSQVQTRGEGRLGPVESLVVIRTVETQPQTWYTLTAAGLEVPLTGIVRAHAERHRVEEGLQEAKGEVGLGHYEVRSWTGWHHHMTLCLLALLFVVLDKLQLGKKNAGDHSGPGTGHLHPAAASSPANVSRNRRGGHQGVAA